MRFYFQLIFIPVILLLFSFNFAHEYFVSITTIDYKKETKTFDITVKLTAHDVEKALVSKGNLKLGDTKEMDNADNILSDYFQKNLNLWVNGGKLQLKFIGKEVEADETLYLYFESNAPKVIRKVKVENTILTQTFSDQNNITYINIGSNKKSYTFKINNSLKEFQFK